MLLTVLEVWGISILLYDRFLYIYSGTPIAAARRAMNLFLQSLPENCYINIYRFGSTFQTLFPESKLLTDEVLEAAKTYVSKTDANLGGTELLSPMQDIFKKKGDKRRNIFVLTGMLAFLLKLIGKDGQVSNEPACIKVVADNNNNNFVFTFGLGSGVSRSLVSGMAKAGNRYFFLLVFIYIRKWNCRVF